MAIATAIALTVVSIAVSATTAGIQAAQQNKQIEYQQEVAKQEAIAAQNKAAAEMKTRRTEAARKQAATRAKMASTGVDSTSGSFLDLVGQGAAAGELDVLKAKHDGDMEAWSLNNKINELETQKKNAWLEAGLAGAAAGISTASSTGLFNSIGKGSSDSSGTTVTSTSKDGTTTTQSFKGSKMQKQGDAAVNNSGGNVVV